MAAIGQAPLDDPAIATIATEDPTSGITRALHATFVQTGFAPYPRASLAPAWGDDDGNGEPDLPLYHNLGSGKFSESPGFRDLLRNGNYHGASWCDYDGDGELDLAILAYAINGSDRSLLLHNLGNGRFEDVAPRLGMDVCGYGETAVWADFDGDGWPDLFTPYY